MAGRLGPVERASGLTGYGTCPDAVVFNVYGAVMTALKAGAMKKDRDVELDWGLEDDVVHEEEDVVVLLTKVLDVKLLAGMLEEDV